MELFLSPENKKDMKIKSFIISLVLPAVAFAQAPDTNILELPMTHHKGSGPFQKIAEYVPMPVKGSEVSALPETAYPKTNGISPRWGKDYASGVIVFDEAQFYYQLFNEGKIDESVLQSKLASLGANVEALSKEPVKCYTSFAYRLNPTGCVVVVDRNNNFDMSDDGIMNIMRPSYMMDIDNGDGEAMLPDYTVWVQYERVQDNRIVADSLPVSMFMPDEGNDLLYTIGVYATAELDGTQIGIAPEKSSNADFSKVVIATGFDESKPAADNLYTEGQVFRAGEKDYKLLGADARKDVLMLELVAK